MRAYIFVPKWLEIIIGCINFIFRILESCSSRHPGTVGEVGG